jgi:AmiR/NasT family two-component response regulator
MANIFMMNEEIARGMVCFFHQKKHSYLIFFSSIGIMGYLHSPTYISEFCESHYIQDGAVQHNTKIRTHPIF